MSVPYAHLLQLATACAERPSVVLTALRDQPPEASAWLASHPDTPQRVKNLLSLQATAATPTLGEWFDPDPDHFSDQHIKSVMSALEE